MALNIPNLDKLIAHLEAQPPEAINMRFIVVRERPECGTAGCILGHADLVFGDEGFEAIDPDDVVSMELFTPDGFNQEERGHLRYPAHRVIATLKRLRDHYLTTGEIVVDWGPEPGDEAKASWTAPKAVELSPPALPEEITRLLAVPSEAARA